MIGFFNALRQAAKRRYLRVAAEPLGAPGILPRWRRDTSGGVALISAVFSIALIGSAAVGVDGAHFFLAKRHQQAATDLAAMAAATSLGTAATTATTVMASNGYPRASLSVTPGVYTANPAVDAGARFTASGAPNAVQVVSTTTEPFIFGGAFGFLMGAPQAGSGFPIRTAAIARKQDQAAFTLGSGLASLDNGLLNTVLGGLLGTNLSLSLLDYQSLASATVDLFSFSDALGTQVHASGPTYGALAVTTVPESTLLNTLATTLQGDVRASAAVRSMAGAVPSGGGGLIGSLIDFGPNGSLRVGATHPLSARVPVLDMLRAVALLGGSSHVVSLDFSTSLPGLGSTQLMMSMGEPAVGSSYFAVGPEGTTLHTAQVRLLLTTQVGGSGLPASLALPLYIQVAPASATITSIACAAGAANASVTLGVTTGVATAAIGNVSASDFGNTASSPAIGPATLINLAGVLRVTASGQATASPDSSIPVSFSAAEIQAGTAKTVSSGLSLAALASSLVNNTQITVSVLGLGLPQPGLPQAVTAALQTALTPIDSLLGQVLSTLGVSVGNATTTVPGVQCSQGLLVN